MVSKFELATYEDATLMDQQLELLLRHLDENRDALWTAVDDVPIAEQSRRPAPDHWSVAEVLEHLVLIDGRVAALFEKGFASAPRRTEAPPPAVAVDSLVDTRRLLDRSRAITSSEGVRPKGALDPRDARAALVEARQKLRGVVAGGDGLALEAVMVPHGVLGPLHLYQWIAFIGAHEARHAAQIREIGKQLRSQE